MYKRRLNPNSVYISFIYNNEVVTEYIPTKSRKMGVWLTVIYDRFRTRFGIMHYYWNIRSYLAPEDRKIEDLRFLIHCFEDHTHNPMTRREKIHSNIAKSMYGVEYTILIQPKIDVEKNKSAIEHPYARAYYKRWLRPNNGEWRRMYHGVENGEYVELVGALIRNLKKEDKRKNKRISYHANKIV